MQFFALASSVLAFALPGPQLPPGCSQPHTVRQGERVVRSIYAGTRRVTRADRVRIGRIERCQRSPLASAVLRRYARHAWTLWWNRRFNQHWLAVHPRWVIPWPIVKCESGGQNLPPNSASASGYYQDTYGTWHYYGGYPEAYRAPKSVQDAFNARLWAGGSGASNWVCARLVAWH